MGVEEPAPIPGVVRRGGRQILGKPGLYKEAQRWAREKVEELSCSLVKQRISARTGAGEVGSTVNPPPRPPALRGQMPMTPPSHWQGHLRQVDVQLLGQLCSLGLEMEALREEMVTFLEEEEEPEGKREEGHLAVSCSAPHHPLADFFEMTI